MTKDFFYKCAELVWYRSISKVQINIFIYTDGKTYGQKEWLIKTAAVLVSLQCLA